MVLFYTLIQPYERFFNPKSKIQPIDTKLCVGVSVAYHLKACIPHYYHGMRIF